MKIIKRGINQQSDLLYHCKICDTIFEVESEEDYDKVIKLSTAGYEGYIKKAFRTFINCPVCGYRFVREIYK